MRIVIIGNGKMANDCLEIVLQSNIHKVVGILLEPNKNPSPAVFLESVARNNIPNVHVEGNINTSSYLDFLNELQPDWIFNINCYQYLKTALLQIPKKGVLNFHNGPLPKYGGVNISSWPIINGETSHGVTWHMVNAGIDTGDILSQSFFEISANTTAAQLMIQSIEKGISVFRENWESWLNGNIQPQPQLGERTYFSKKDLAPNLGRLDWHQSAEELHRLVLGLHLFPYPNDFAYAHLVFQGETYWVISSEFDNDENNAVPGTILERNSKYCKIKCGKGNLKLKMIAPAFGKPVKWDHWYMLLDQLSIQILD